MRAVRAKIEEPHGVFVVALEFRDETCSDTRIRFFCLVPCSTTPISVSTSSAVVVLHATKVRLSGGRVRLFVGQTGLLHTRAHACKLWLFLWHANHRFYRFCYKFIFLFFTKAINFIDSGIDIFSRCVCLCLHRCRFHFDQTCQHIFYVVVGTS